MALVRGAALGGGFETALAARYIVAEKSATFGFPELVFGMFPGMGALQLLSLRLPHIKALRIIESARTYTAEQAFELGLVDRLVGDGEGHKCIDELVRRGLRQGEGHRALQRVGFEAQREALQSLRRVADEWVRAALTLPDTQLSIIERISDAQLASEPRLTIATTTIRA
ncbi:MAG: DSF synthase [Gammaproteobacteria bacterium]